MERKLLDMTNQLFIGEYNSRVDYGDQFEFDKERKEKCVKNVTLMKIE